MDDREILFRGKRTDNGEWAEGFYFNMRHNDERTHVHHFIIPLNTPIPKEKPIGEIQVEVDSNTLGRYTGLTDRNGKMIFEGDVLAISGHREYPVVVRFETGSYVCRSTNDKGYLHRIEYDSNDKYEVIGHIYDNPELIGGQDG